MQNYKPSNIFTRARLVLTRHVTEYAPAKTEEYPTEVKLDKDSRNMFLFLLENSVMEKKEGNMFTFDKRVRRFGDILASLSRETKLNIRFQE